MAVQSYNTTTGAPQFTDTGAPDLAVDQTAVGAFAAQVGTRLIGTTAERTAYAYKRKGLAWYDTSTSSVWTHNGTAWVNDPALTSIALTPVAGSGVDVSAVKLSRAGFMVFLEGDFTTNAALALPASSAFVTIGIIPDGFRPVTNQRGPWSAHSTAGLTINAVYGANGNLNLRAPAAATIPTNTSLMPSVTCWRTA